MDIHVVPQPLLKGSGGTKIQQSDSTKQGADHTEAPEGWSSASTEEYPEELRERAFRFAPDLVDGPEKLSVNASCKRGGAQLGIVPDSLRNWVQQARIDAGSAPGLTTDERARLVELERENRELRRANATLKSASAELTGQRNSAAASLSAGVSKSRVFRGREFSLAAIASRSSWVARISRSSGWA